MSRSHASKKDPFPKERNGYLDVDKLKKHGLTLERLKNKDAFFFHQLLLPVHDSKNTGIDEDGQMPYYTKKAAWSNIYKYTEFAAKNGPMTKAKETSPQEEV